MTNVGGVVSQLYVASYDFFRVDYQSLGQNPVETWIPLRGYYTDSSIPSSQQRILVREIDPRLGSERDDPFVVLRDEFLSIVKERGYSDVFVRVRRYILISYVDRSGEHQREYFRVGSSTMLPLSSEEEQEIKHWLDASILVSAVDLRESTAETLFEAWRQLADAVPSSAIGTPDNLAPTSDTRSEIVTSTISS